MVSFITIMGALALAGGSMTYYTLPMGLNMSLGMFINLKEGGMIFPLYMKPPFPSQSTFYIYEVKNPRETLTGADMKLNLRGPYKFNTYMHRDKVSFSNSGQLVSFDTHRKLQLQEDQSAKDLDDKYWVLNPILPAVLIQVKNIVLDRIPFQSISEPIVFNGLNVILDNFKERLFVKRSPRTLLMGRKVELLESIVGLADSFGLKSIVPPGPPENIFGVAHFQNETVDSIEVWAGVGESKSKFGEVSKWRGKTKMTQWRGKCNIIDGTNGELYKAFPEKGKSIKVFVSQFCRTFYLDPVQDDPIQIQDGLVALEYKLTDQLFLGAKKNPENKCYCRDVRTYDCQYDGLISMAPCFFDAPLFFAKPNLKGVDKRIRRMVDESTLEYDFVPDKQSFYIDPVTGSILKANLTLTALMKVVRQPYMRDLNKVRNLTYAPVFVASESIELPPSVSWQLKYLQMLVENHKPASVVAALGGSGVLLMKFLTKNRRRNKLSSSIESQPQPQQVTTDQQANQS